MIFVTGPLNWDLPSRGSHYSVLRREREGKQGSWFYTHHLFFSVSSLPGCTASWVFDEGIEMDWMWATCPHNKAHKRLASSLWFSSQKLLCRTSCDFIVERWLQGTYGRIIPAGNPLGFVWYVSSNPQNWNIKICLTFAQRDRMLPRWMSQSRKMSITIYSHILGVFEALDMSG